MREGTARPRGQDGEKVSYVEQGVNRLRLHNDRSKSVGS